MARPLLYLSSASMSQMSIVLAVTDLTTASYKLVGFAAFIAGSDGGEVVLVSTYAGSGPSRSSEPPVSHRGDSERWRQQLEATLQQEGQLLERQRQWCSDQGVRCRAELYEEGHWPELVLQSARRSRVDLILVGLPAIAGADQVTPDDLAILAQDAPCPVSIVRLPALAAF